METMLSTKRIVLGLLFGLSICLPTVAQTQPVDLRLDSGGRVHFIAFGDTRFTDPGDTGAANPEVRQKLVQAVADAHPNFVSLGGDIAYNGSDANDWKVYDSETAAWRKGHIHIYPALGNHDLQGDLKTCLANYFQRFPELRQSRYYSLRAGSVFMVTLDSSLDELSGPQGEWLKNEIDTVPADVDFLVIVLHHPPYTSSSPSLAGGHSARPAEQALAKYLEERQGRMRARIVVFAGHVHNYERFEHGGVTYFVTGGGGAHPYAIKRKPSDQYRGGGVNYHYIDVHVDGGRMVATMIRLGLKKGSASWSRPDSVTIVAPAIGAARAN